MCLFSILARGTWRWATARSLWPSLRWRLLSRCHRGLFFFVQRSLVTCNPVRSTSRAQKTAPPTRGGETPLRNRYHDGAGDFLRPRQNQRAVGGDGDGVSSKCASSCRRGHRGPIVVEYANRRATHADHRLDGRGHAPLQRGRGPARRSWAPAGPCITVPMPCPTNAHHRKPFSSTQLCTAWRCRSAGCRAGPARWPVQRPAGRGAVLQLRAQFCRRAGDRGIAVVAVELRTEVKRDDVAVLQLARPRTRSRTISLFTEVHSTHGKPR